MEEKKQQRSAMSRLARGMAGRRKFSASEISAVLKRYRASGKNRREFCDLEGISYSSLGNWLRAKKKRRACLPDRLEKFPAKKSDGFIALDLSGPAAAAVMQISFQSGPTISFFAEPRAEFVKQLLA